MRWRCMWPYNVRHWNLVEIAHYVKSKRWTHFWGHLLWNSHGRCEARAGVLVMCHEGKELSLKLAKTPMVGLAKWNLVSMDQMKNEQIVVVARLEWLQLTHGEARKDRPPLNHICGMLVRYKDILTNRLFKRINDHQGVENNFAQ
jgi:hypothetical protein